MKVCHQLAVIDAKRRAFDLNDEVKRRRSDPRDKRRGGDTFSANGRHFNALTRRRGGQQRDDALGGEVRVGRGRAKCHQMLAERQLDHLESQILDLSIGDPSRREEHVLVAARSILYHVSFVVTHLGERTVPAGTEPIATQP